MSATDRTDKIRNAWRTAVTSRTADGLLLRREASWRERGQVRRLAGCACLAADVVLADDSRPPTDPLTPQNSGGSLRITPPPPPTPPRVQRGSSFKKSKPDVLAEQEPKKNIRFADAPTTRPRRNSLGAQQLVWERMLMQQLAQSHPQHTPYFNNSFHTVWASSPPDAPSSIRSAHSPQRAAEGCECYCSLPCTARLWAASKWYVCFLPALLIVPVGLLADLLCGGCCIARPSAGSPPPSAGASFSSAMVLSTPPTKKPAQ